MREDRTSAVSENAVSENAAINNEEADRDNVVVSLGVPPVNGSDSDDTAASVGEPFGRFRRHLERFRGAADPLDDPSNLDEMDLRLQVMLLREENARLKAARHQPSSAGTAIDQLRQLGSPVPRADDADDAWSVFSECLLIREGLDQACEEFEKAVTAVRERLAILTTSIETVAPPRELHADGAS
jgi:hypothetical protein